MTPILNSQQFDLHWRGMLSDYVTAIAWSPQGRILAVSSAAGEVMLWRDLLPSGGEVAWPLLPLQMADSQSINCLAFSKDGQFLAAGGQDGRVKIWRLRLDLGVYRCRPLHILEKAPAGVDTKLPSKR